MKAFISADMEGVAGIVHWDQVDPSGPDYERSRALLLAEVNAAVAGACDGGAASVVVNDAHDRMRNLPPEGLDARARLLSGSLKSLSMVEGLQDGGFAAALFVGYHGRAGCGGVLAHTYSSATVHELRLNGRPAGEVTINAAAAGALGVPVALVTGDEEAVAEARDLLGDGVETVAVKAARSRSSALSLHPEEARAAIREAAGRALRRAPSLRPWLPSPPYAFEVRFVDAGMAEAALLLPGAERADATTVRFTHPDYLAAFKAMRALLLLARSTL